MTNDVGTSTLECLWTAERAEYLLNMRAVPGTVAIIAAADGADGTGMAATAWNSLCADPPMLLECVNRNASAHALIRRSGAFSVNVVPVDDQETVAIFSAQRVLKGSARFLEGQWDRRVVGQPLLKRAIAAFKCSVVDDLVYGTHSLFIGEIRSMRRQEGAEAMIYLNGGFTRAERLAYQ